MGRLIKQGVQGADVRAVQDVLNFHIRRLAPLKVDGIFGPLTNARVVEFQKSNQLKPDGIVGPNTMAKLFEEEQLPLTLALVPQGTSSSTNSSRLGIQPPRLIPPLTLPPITPPLTPPVLSPFFLPPDSNIKAACEDSSRMLSKIALKRKSGRGERRLMITAVEITNMRLWAIQKITKILKNSPRMIQSFEAA